MNIKNFNFFLLSSFLLMNSYILNYHLSRYMAQKNFFSRKTQFLDPYRYEEKQKKNKYSDEIEAFIENRLEKIKKIFVNIFVIEFVIISLSTVIFFPFEKMKMKKKLILYAMFFLLNLIYIIIFLIAKNTFYEYYLEILEVVKNKGYEEMYYILYINEKIEHDKVLRSADINIVIALYHISAILFMCYKSILAILLG